MARIDKNAIILQLSAQKSARDAIGHVMDQRAQEIVEENKNTFIQGFIDLPVSQEIAAGPDGENISGTLDGKGNLYTFIGFEYPAEPIEDAVKILDESIKIDPNSKIQGRDSKGKFKAGGDRLLFDYKIDVPSREDLENQKPLQLPWEKTRSWLYAVEEGISGFTSYIYWKKAGRSTSGLQAKSGRGDKGRFDGSGSPMQLRSGSFKNTSYFSAAYNNFKKLFKNAT